MPGEPAGATFREVEGVRLRVFDQGQGPAVVLLHGFASSLQTWEKVIPLLSSDHRVIALDLKGFGWSDRPEGDYSPSAQARLVLALLDQLGVGKADLVAHSWGSAVALSCALQAPERVGRLVLYSAWVFDEQLPMFMRWAQLPGLGEALYALFYDQRPDDRMALSFYDPRNLPEDLIEGVERALERPGTKAAALAATRGQNFQELQERYGAIRQATLLLWGREDAVSLLKYGERLARLLPEASLRVYPQCGHFPMLEAAVESSRDLLRFLSGGGS
jgi:pimeloyl-ACP methyl ester carboxylesterase